MKRILLFAFIIVAGVSTVISQNVVDFEELQLEEPESYWNGSDQSGSFTSKYLKFYNNYQTSSYGDSWMGFAYSNTTDTTTPGYLNQYSSANGSGVDNSSNYAVCYVGIDWSNGNAPIPSIIKIDNENAPESYNGMYISLNTYTSLYMNQMTEGSYETEKYWLTLQVKAINTSSLEETTRNFVIADYRFENESGFKLADWTYIDMSWADGKDSLCFTMDSNDTIGEYGINTPLYFCMDNFGADAPENIPALITDTKNYYEITEGESVELFVSAKNGLQPYSFEWSNSESLSNNNLQLTIASPAQTTTYTVTVTDSKGNTSEEEIIVNVKGVNAESHLFENLQVYCTNDGNNIIVSNQYDVDFITIFDINGKKVMEQNINNSNNINIPISHLSRGLYIVNLNIENNQVSRKIIK
jgi:hypothetical protein